MDSYLGSIGLAASVITFISVTMNIIQFLRRRQEIKTLRSQAQESYNLHFLIARACTRARKGNITSKGEGVTMLTSPLNYISGVSDSARTAIISFSREHLGFIPFYEHPAEPGKEQPPEVVFGKPPDECA